MFACQEDCSRGPLAPENQSAHQTRGKHKEVNDKQMKGRISDTCSLSLLTRLSDAAFLSCLPDCLMPSMHGFLLVDGISRCYQSQNLFFFFLASSLVSLPTDSAQNDNDSAATGCLLGAVPDSGCCLVTCLPLSACLADLRTPLSFTAVYLPGHPSILSLPGLRFSCTPLQS